VESAIVNLKQEKLHWGARKIRERLLRRFSCEVKVPARSTIHAVLDLNPRPSVPQIKTFSLTSADPARLTASYFPSQKD
jgi:hypothetical protein